MNENSTIHRLIPLACLSTLFICLPHLATGQVNQDNIYDPGILKPTDINKRSPLDDLVKAMRGIKKD